MSNATSRSTTYTSDRLTPAPRKRPPLHPCSALYSTLRHGDDTLQHPQSKKSDKDGPSTCTRQKAWCLLSYEELPAYLQINRFIKGGYTGRQTRRQCIRNLFRWNNETVNIWSHLLSFLWLFGMLCYDNWWTIPAQRGGVLDHVFISIELLSFMVCVLCSTGYHTFRCRSKQHFDLWLSLDLAGVAVAGLGVYLPGLHLLFSCFPTARLVYLSSASVLVLVMVLVMPLRPLRHLRVPLGMAWLSFSVVPAVHWFWLMGGVEGRFAQAFLPRLWTTYALLMLAAGVYVSKLPECVLEGQVDLLGASHQLWHVLVSIILYYWHNTVLIILHEKNVNSCP